ncbi:hypothetical protein SDC9_143983 [bioreactor metagenome]|uniref:Uncharacterized protein n=1 Tax=bioreactor metagenome TaxID=1076179 RepID=A0A645E605_9ZZZZ
MLATLGFNLVPTARSPLSFMTVVLNLTSFLNSVNSTPYIFLFSSRKALSSNLLPDDMIATSFPSESYIGLAARIDNGISRPTASPEQVFPVL